MAALQAASKNGHEKVVELLLDNGAVIYLTGESLHIFGIYGDTSL